MVAFFVVFNPNLTAFDQEIIFEDNFDGGSMENWMQSLGDWSSENNSLCTILCGG
jgi:hypothetical protein